MSNEGKATWTDIATPEADRLRDFYAAVAGWTADPCDGDYNMIDTDGNQVCGICHPVESVPAEAMGNWQLYFAVADVSGATERVRQNGGAVLGTPSEKWSVIRDPAGATLSLYAAEGSEPSHLAWTDIMVPNAAALRDFYAKSLGWTPQDVDMGEYCDFAMNAADGSGAAGICHPLPGAPAEAVGKWVPYFKVADADVAATRAAQLGGRVLIPISTGEGYGTWCFIADPVGGVCALISP